jgi:hypothetical protein
MKISEIRSVIESLNWNRHDLDGRDARRVQAKCDVRDRLMKHVNAT